MILGDIKYIVDKYGDHPGTYRDKSLGSRPMLYFYDCRFDDPNVWASILSDDGENTIRGTKYDVVVIANLVAKERLGFIKAARFDGIYSYFAVHDNFSYGATSENWPELAKWCRENDILFIPSVGPGYDDERMRPWNTRNTRSREEGKYYDRHFQRAIDVDPPFISITSFNEWHEGSIIEPAIPKSVDGITYFDFSPHYPEYYLDRTRHWIEIYLSK